MTKLQTITASHINSLHDELVGMLTNSLHKAAEIGHLLTEKKQQLRHGEFTAWVNSNLTFTDRTARNYMRLYENRHQLTGAGSVTGAYKLLTEPKTETVSEMQPEKKYKSFDLMTIAAIKMCKSKSELVNVFNQVDGFDVWFADHPFDVEFWRCYVEPTDSSNTQVLDQLNGCCIMRIIIQVGKAKDPLPYRSIEVNYWDK